MKRYISSVITIVTLIIINGAIAFAGPMALAQNFNLTPIKPDFTVLTSMDNITCGVGGTIKWLPTTENEITYWIEYTNKGIAINRPYEITASTPAEIFIKIKGDDLIAAGSGRVKFATEKNTGSFTFANSRAKIMNLTANINGKKCTAKDLVVIKKDPVAPIPGPVVIAPGGVVPPLAVDLSGINPPNAPASSCKVIAQGVVDNYVLTMGAALQFQNFPAGSYTYSLRGYSESSPNDIREFTGTFKAPGNGYVMNNNSGFLFKLPLTNMPLTYVISGKLGNKDCSLVSFAAPARQVAASTNSNSPDTSTSAGTPAGTTSSSTTTPAATINNQVQIFGQTPEDTQAADSLKLAVTATDQGASQTALYEDNSVPSYFLYILIAVVAGLGGYVVYLLTTKKTN